MRPGRRQPLVISARHQRRMFRFHFLVATGFLLASGLLIALLWEWFRPTLQSPLALGESLLPATLLAATGSVAAFFDPPVSWHRAYDSLAREAWTLHVGLVTTLGAVLIYAFANRKAPFPTLRNLRWLVALVAVNVILLGELFLHQMHEKGVSQLHVAAHHDLPLRARVFLGLGSDPDAPSAYSLRETPLYVAVHARHLRTAEVLLKHAGDRISTSTLRQCVMRSVAEDDRETLDLLLRHANDPAIHQPGGPAPSSIRLRGLRDRFARLPQVDRMTLWRMRATHRSPLGLAIQLDHVEACRLLLQYGADPNIDSPTEAFTIAVAVDGTEPRSREANEAMAFDIACATGNTFLHSAVHRNQQAIVRLLLEAGANPASVNAAGNTPLHVAALSGPDQEPNVLALLASGADPNARNREGLRPLDVAADPHVLESLRAHVDSRSAGFPDTRRGLAFTHVP